MNVFTKFTLRNLRRNRMRTVVTVIGIILSVSMFTAVTESFYSGQQYLISAVGATVGSFHAEYTDLDEAQLEKLAADPDYTGFTTAQHIGFAKVDSANEGMPYIRILGIGKDFTDTVAVRLLEGRMPEQPGEIVLSRHLYTGGRVNYKTGDTLTLGVGRRFMDGEAWDEEMPYNSAEELADVQTKIYRVVGICERPDRLVETYEQPGYTAYTVGEQLPDAHYTAFFTAKDPQKTVVRGPAETEYGVMTNKNSDLFMFNGYDTGSAFIPLLYGLGTVLILIIMAGSVALIYNSFSISVTERTKQFGVLRSVGATKKQMVRTVLTEALILCGFAVPFGLAAGCGGIAVTFRCLSRQFAVLVGEMYDNSDGVTIRLIPNVWALLAAAVISVLTALISAYIPARRAMKRSAIEAVRMSGDIADKGMKIRSGKLMNRLFGFPGMLAKKNFSRNRKRYRTTIVSLALSLVLFISASSLCFYFNRSFSLGTDFYDFDIEADIGPGSADEEDAKDRFAVLSGIQGVEGAQLVSCVGSEFLSFYAGTQYFNDDYTRIVLGGEKDISDRLSVHFLDDASFCELLSANGLSEKDYFGTEKPAGLLYDNMKVEGVDENDQYVVTTSPMFAPDSFPCTLDALLFTDPDLAGKMFTGKISGGKAEYYDSENDQYFEEPVLDNAKERELLLSAKIENKPFCIPANSTVIFYPESRLAEVYGGKQDRIDHIAYFKCTDHEKVMEAMYAASEEWDGIYFSDYASDHESEKALMTLVTVFSYGFITLISLIAAANVFNTVSTNVMLRRRELAMLRSVGLSGRGFRKMTVFESLLYGFRSIVIGLPAALAISFVIWFIVSDSGFRMSFSLPFAQIAFAIVSVFAVVLASMIYSMNKIRKYNTADELKNENL